MHPESTVTYVFKDKEKTQKHKGEPYVKAEADIGQMCLGMPRIARSDQKAGGSPGAESPQSSHNA